MNKEQYERRVDSSSLVLSHSSDLVLSHSSHRHESTRLTYLSVHDRRDRVSTHTLPVAPLTHLCTQMYRVITTQTGTVCL